MFGRSDIRKEYAAEIREIDRGKRKTANHNPPAELGGVLTTEADEAVFQEFRRFGHVFNRYLGDAPDAHWTVHEMDDTDIGDLSGPLYGRQYAVTYNDLGVGRLQIGAEGHSRLRHQPPFGAHASVEVRYAQFLPYQDLHWFLTAISDFLAFIPDSSESHQINLRRVESAMLRHLWEAARISDVALDLEFSAQGAFAWFRQLSEARAYAE